MGRKEYQKEYRELHKEEIKEYKKSWYLQNKEKVLIKSKEYYEQNKEKIKERNKLYLVEKNNSDMNYKIKFNVLSSITDGLRSGCFEPRLEKMLGYTAQDLIKHLETNFDEDMTWDNFGSRFINTRNWQIHHFIPMKIYNFYNETDIRKCWDLANLVPIWNEKRHDNIDWGDIEFRHLDRILPDTILIEELT